MQTIKTAAIVVLLMSVIYGAYVSLTTPPESLPPGVEDMIVMDDTGDMSIESALPPSLGDLEINAGFAEGDSAGFAGNQGDSAMASDVIASMAGAASNGLTGAVNNPMANNSMASAPMVSDAMASDPMASDPVTEIASTDPNFSTSLQTSPGFSTTLTDRGGTSGQSGNRNAGLIDPVTGYASTGRTFSMPDPTNLDPSLIGGQAQPIAGGQTGPDQPATRIGEKSISQVSAIDSSRSIGLSNAIRTADLQFQKDERKEALSTLSIFYGTPNLSGEQRSELLSRLDPLAADVIYSANHLLERPHRVGSNETLVKIAQRYEVPWQLLANINQVRDPVTILPGTELKVVRGPFRAEVDLSQSELTLFLGDLYAGRFPIAVGNDPAPKPGIYTVQDKQTSKVFYDATGAALPPGSPGNPYGNVWIDLGGSVCIHGSPNTTKPTNQGCISLAADYADDLYGILSQGSTITIK